MSHRLPSSPRRGGFTLSEMMIGLSVFAVGASIVVPLLVSDLNLYARNFSINKSNNSLRHGLQTLKNDIEMAMEPPVLMSYRTSGSTGVLKPLAVSATAGEAILMWVNRGPAYDLYAPGTSPATITPANGFVLNAALASPAPNVGDRLIIMSPGPYDTGMPETVNMDGANIVKPGRRITRVTGPVSFTSSGGTKYNQFTVNVDLTNPLPTTGILSQKSVYLAREVAYVANTLTDAGGNVVERQLLYYSSTDNMAVSKLITRDLDPTPQTKDALTASPLCFNYSTGLGTLTPLRINLPIRALDYAHAIADRNMGSQTVDSSAAEFNVFFRSNPQMSIKERMY